MCGIVYQRSFNGKTVNTAIAEAYKKQRSRGHEGFGFFLPEQDKLAHNPAEKRIMKLLEKPANQATEILFHHRYPTSTANVRNACHPFSTKSNKDVFTHNYVLVHNGVVSNAYELHKDHVENYGIKYVSEQEDGRFNDSEALLYDVAMYLDGIQDRIKARGSIAFIVKADDGSTFFARNTGSPLTYTIENDQLEIRSEGGKYMVEANQLYEFVTEDQSFIKIPVTIETGWSYGRSSKSYSYAGYGNGYVYDPLDADADDYYEKKYDSGRTTFSRADKLWMEAWDLSVELGSAWDAIEYTEGVITDTKAKIAQLKDSYRMTGAWQDSHDQYKQEDILDDQEEILVYLEELAEAESQPVSTLTVGDIIDAEASPKATAQAA